MREPKEVSPTSAGWVRVPKLDKGQARAWERPDGSLYLFPPGVRNALVLWREHDEKAPKNA